jgi:serine/threonine protein phosphatase PrpC
MAKQLRYAIYDPAQDKKCETGSFKVTTPCRCWPFFLKSSPRETGFAMGVEQSQGSKNFQEDGYMTEKKVEFSCQGRLYTGEAWAVFDGHADDGALGEQLEAELPDRLGKAISKNLAGATRITDEAICNAFVSTYHEFNSQYKGKGGTTCLSLFKYDHKLYFVNVGDSRAILVKKDVIRQLTEDQGAGNPRCLKSNERRGNIFLHRDQRGVLRVCEPKKGYKFDDVERITDPKGNPFTINMGRDLGIPWLEDRPKITQITIGKGIDNPEKGVLYCQPGDYLVLATDGLYHCATTEEVGEAVRILAKEGCTVQEIASRLAIEADAYIDSDNITVMVLKI